MVGETPSSSISSSADDVAAATQTSSETATTEANCTPNPLPTSNSSSGAVPIDDPNLVALPLLQSYDAAANEHDIANVDDAVNEKGDAFNKDDHGIIASSTIIRPPAMTGFQNHTMMKEHAVWDDDDSSIPPPPPATEIHCRQPDDDLVSTVSSITRATSVGETAAASHGVRVRSYHAQHMGNLMNGGEMMVGPVPSTIGGTPPPLPIGAFYEQSQRRSRTAKDSVGDSSNGSSSGNKSHDKQGSALSSCEVVKMPPPSSPRRPCQEKDGANDLLGPNRPCDNKQLVAGGSLGAANEIEQGAGATSRLENDDIESGHFSTDTLAVAHLVSSPPPQPPPTATTVPTISQSYSHSLQHDPHMPQQQQRSAAAEAAREEFRRQVRSELLQDAVRAEPVSSSAQSRMHSTVATASVQPISTSAKRMSNFRTKVVAFGILVLLAVVTVAVSVGASLGRKSEPSKSSIATAGSSSPPSEAAAAPKAIVYLDDGRQAFTTTQQLYDAVDDYLQTNQDDNDEATAVNSSMTAAALTFGYPIGTWDVSRISDFSLVFCPNRDMKMDLGARFAAYSSFNEDLSGWNVSNAITMHGMFAACPAFVGEGIDNWDTSRVADFSSLLLGAKAFVGNVSTWDTSSALIMKGMFSGAEKYNGDLSTFNLTKVHSTARMFSRSFAFEGLGLSEWNVANVRDMNCMFCQAKVFNGFISAWDTSHVEDMANMFHTAETFNGDLSSWQVGRVSTLECMFALSESFQGVGLSNWNTSRVTTLKQTFAFSAFNADLSRWDVGLVNDFTESFKNAKSFKGDLSRWNTSSAQDMNAMFLEATSFSSDLSSWDVSRVQDLELMLAGASSFNYSLCSWGPQLPSTVNVQEMFSGTAACETQSEPSALNLSLGPFCRFCG